MPVATGEVQVTYVTGPGDDVTAGISKVDARQLAEGSPVREFPVYVGRRNYSGYFWSSTMSRHVVYESLLELSWLWLADFDPAVARIAAQPMRLRGRDGDRVRNRIPDFISLLRDGTVRVVDVKPAAMLATDEVEASLAWTRGVCRSRGWEYEIWTGPDPTTLRNVQWIAAARQPHMSASLDARATTVKASGGCTFGELEARLRAEGRAAPRLEILGAIWRGLLTCDLSVPLCSQSWLEPVDE
ncbi:TnsA-like heteromeric transposase endonuclease subunit [Cellulosimicrobium funkei]|uniref:TnsA-like heteromeric transposase endonuclease subunit n=1 Tax=Cellulosimicrobium funkei TaxID=264251 RepID=A0A4Y8QXY3_9MICO|nr:TnsA-like heteromeric transposase endonuclease subunit [Cellulosimicrobium funkei]TFF05184.1 TnsA-like heteromeric transposase endonuclease subunit [Cellulosimicrobium funkei]TGA69579.1 TnsA-like heteromeric transposase endonuclease subunit [Cellulosimicrobium terreum]